MIGLEAKLNNVKAKYAYARIEGDSVPWFTSDSDFGSAALRASRSTNVCGHSLGLEYSFSKNFTLGGSITLTELIEAESGRDQEGTLYQLDMVYKF